MRRLIGVIAYILSGQRMIERLTMRGHPVSLTGSEVTHAAALLVVGIGMAQVEPPFGGTSMLGIAGSILAAVQVTGILMAWIGVMAPRQRVRITALIVSIGWWCATLTLLLASGAPVSVVLLLMIIAINCMAAARSAVSAEVPVLSAVLRDALSAIDPPVMGHRSTTQLSAFRRQ